MKIICPICHQSLTCDEKIYKCPNNHSFDRSKYGYVNLLPLKKLSGDNKDMVIARRNFLEKGFYDFLVSKIIEKTSKQQIDILDCGCGEGFYTNKISNMECKNVIGLDISKEAIKLASKKYKEITFIVGNTFHMPIQSHCVDLLINICAPHQNEEFLRVLKSEGRLIKVIPGRNHLIEIKKELYDKTYENDVLINDLPSFSIIEKLEVIEHGKLDQEDICNLVKMTPYFYKTSTLSLNNLFNKKEMDVTFNFIIYVYEVKSVNK